MSTLHLGGAETALLGLLENMDYDKYDVDLFLYRHEGELLPYLPKQVNLLPELPAYGCLTEGVLQSFRRGYYRIVLQRIIAKIQVKRRYPGVSQASINGDYMYKRLVRYLPEISPSIKYDLAVSFIFPHYFVPAKVRSHKKVAWIHTDYTSVALDVSSQLKMWKKFDKIISISEEVTKSFCTVFPSLKERIEIIENILPERYIRKRSQEEMPNLEQQFACQEIKLLSIGRFTPPKNFDNVPAICRKIIEMGVAVKWYLIGYGSDEELIRRKIAEENMKTSVTILGKKENPYPYIRYCDVYIQPSRYEGKSVAVREAQLLGKPVIITDFPTADSQVRDGEDGIIVPMENDKCARAIAQILQNKPLLKRISACCSREDIALHGEIRKFYRLL